LPNWAIASAAGCWRASRPLRRQTRFSAGIASSSPVSGRMPAPAVGAQGCGPTSVPWWSGWPSRIRRGVTRRSKLLKNLGRRVGLSTIARILKTGGDPSQPLEPDDVADVRAGALTGARRGRPLYDDVWAVRGLVTYCRAISTNIPDCRARVLVI
jgi:hypothetical protein